MALRRRTGVRAGDPRGNFDTAPAPGWHDPSNAVSWSMIFASSRSSRFGATCRALRGCRRRSTLKQDLIPAAARPSTARCPPKRPATVLSRNSPTQTSLDLERFRRFSMRRSRSGTQLCIRRRASSETAAALRSVGASASSPRDKRVREP